ncbi:hypothetical protein C8R43DRAFT_1116421 [Mycena crocata]|nr:hypothetical protein C8R43DRAFT_1116421 [Mycena crocata]
MSKRRHRDRHIDIPPDIPSSTGGPSIPPPASETILLETSHVNIDGSVRRGAKMVEVPGSPSSNKENTALLLRPDDPPEIRQPTGPLYDLHGQLDDDDDFPPPVDEEGRDMRHSDFPLREWARESREDFLVEMLRMEGRGDHRSYDVCPLCSAEKAEYRCTDCLGGDQLICQACIVNQHIQQPLHRVELWNGQFFDPTTLKALGLRIQLGHWTSVNPRCRAPEPAAGDAFVIVDDHGVHEVNLDYCGCGGGSKTRQLLRARLFPATVQAPRTAGTFSVMRRFQLISYESKCSAYEFYHSLARETNNTGVGEPTKDRYHEFLRMAREWENLEMLKRAGRGHDPTGAAGTGLGECALLCPACPHPGKNLPPNWKDVPEDQKFLYALFLAMDANFRLKRKDVSSEDADPGLSRGWSFFTEVSAYMAHLADNWDMPQERSTCVAHDAVDQPDKEARGTASSGIGAVDCARHNMKRPNAVGDLQFGERYINIDYMFFKSMAGTSLDRFFVSYDIACQWHKNIWVRMAKYNPEIHYIHDVGKFMTFLVPKFHLPAHIEACNLNFSFNLTRWVGRTDGEAPERGWANANPLAGSTKEMGPGARRDALDNHFNDWNYKKIIALGRVMLKKMEEAVPEMVETAAALTEMESALARAAGGAESSPVVKWTEMARKWEAPPTAPTEPAPVIPEAPPPNPFETVHKDEHLAHVRHQLAVEAANREATGKQLEGEVREDMHITEMISMGLQLERQQRGLGFDVAATGLHPTTEQRRAMVERTSKMRRKIIAWMAIQHDFFPAVKVLRQREDAARAKIARTQPIQGVEVHDIRLWLPSGMMRLPGAALAITQLLKDAVDHEYRLRVGQANEALHEIRGRLLVRSALYKRKDARARGVRENMRSNAKLDGLNAEIYQMAEEYRTARGALEVLGVVLGKQDWAVTLKPLAEGDIRGMPRATFADPDRQRGAKGKGRKGKRPPKKKKKVEQPLSWIWTSQVNPGDPESVNEALRIEWAKTRARAMRWAEEVALLEEEMRRIGQFLTWRAGWWTERADGRQREDGPQREGERAYAWQHAKLQTDLCERFETLWKDLPELVRKGRSGELEVQVTLAAGSVSRVADEDEDEDDSESSSSEDDSSSSGSEDDSDEGARPVPLPRRGAA